MLRRKIINRQIVRVYKDTNLSKSIHSCIDDSHKEKSKLSLNMISVMNNYKNKKLLFDKVNIIYI